LLAHFAIANTPAPISASVENKEKKDSKEEKKDSKDHKDHPEGSSKESKQAKEEPPTPALGLGQRRDDERQRDTASRKSTVESFRERGLAVHTARIEEPRFVSKTCTLALCRNVYSAPLSHDIGSC
jgi:hypothetical protein